MNPLARSTKEANGYGSPQWVSSSQRNQEEMRSDKAQNLPSCKWRHQRESSLGLRVERWGETDE